MDLKEVKSIMNPIRIKIIQELSIKKTATTNEIAQACGDIPQSTLYRHLYALMKSGVIQVVSENKVRGIMEKVYGIKENPSQTINDNLEKITKDELSSLFSQFVISILSDFNSCISEPEIMKSANKVFGFTSNSLLLTDDEFIEMVAEINQIIIQKKNNPFAAGRKLRRFSTIITTESYRQE
jgi:predicted transcriptional regulator